MTNGFANGMWKQTVKTAVGSASSIILIHFADPQNVIFSWPWFRHFLIAVAILTIVNEAKYWKAWADSPTNGVPPNGGV